MALSGNFVLLWGSPHFQFLPIKPHLPSNVPRYLHQQQQQAMGSR